MNFERDSSTSLGMTNGTVEEAIAYEFGYFLEYCSKLAVIDADLPLEVRQVSRTKARVVEIKKHRNLEKYELFKDKTVFKIKGDRYSFKAILPEEIFYSIAMCKAAVEYLNLPFDMEFTKFDAPPGRSSIFKGIIGISIIDSCYNANFSSMKAILNMFDQIPGDNKWVVLGDMLEQGKGEREEHEKLADLIGTYDFERIILMGPRVSKYTHPKLMDLLDSRLRGNDRRRSGNDGEGGVLIEKFLGPKETLD